MKKVLVVTIMILFISISIIPSTGNIVSFDDTTPPITTHRTNPLKPNGRNGYYNNNVTIILKSTDDLSGVNRIEYRINAGSWGTILGDNGTFIMDEDGNDVLIEYYAIDNVGNKENIKSFTLDRDTTPPIADEIIWEAWNKGDIWYMDLIANAVDETSGMDRIDFFYEDEYIETIEGHGPEYVFTIEWSDSFYNHIFYFHHYDRTENLIIVEFRVKSAPPPPKLPFLLFGIISNKEISKENVSFFAIMVFNFNCFEPIIFKHLTARNDYRGHIGRFFICAIFPDDEWLI